jgi:group I intron endonuclease
MKKLCGIYEIVNIVNDKRYIGQSKNIYVRFRSHKNKLRNNQHHNSYLQNAWNKYGENNFIFNVIKICDDTELDDLEKQYIGLYNTCNRKCGYNIDNGGNSNKHLSTETREKISKAHKKENLSVETLKKMSDSAKRRCSTQEWKQYYHNVLSGRSLSEETRLKMSEAHINKSHSEEARKKIRKANMGDPVMCVELNLVFECAKDAGVQLNIGNTASGPILECCRGKRKTYGGYHWQFATNIQKSDDCNEVIQ